jgi:hypothetical protein
MDYPEFNALVYSIDAFFPFVSLHMEDYWVINPECPTSRLWLFPFKYGGFARFYLWFHIGMGWILSAFAALTVANQIKRE